MPAIIKMRLSNNNPTAAQISNMTAKNALTAQQNRFIPNSLNSSMITRIHNLKPGCGGCGRH